MRLKFGFAPDGAAEFRREYTRDEINQLALVTGNVMELAGIMLDHALAGNEDAGKYAAAFEIIKLLIEPVDDFLEDAHFNFAAKPEPAEAPR